FRPRFVLGLLYDSVPAPRWRFDFDGLVRLRLWFPVFDDEFCGCQHRYVELRRNVVAFVRSFGIAMFRGKRKPLVGFGIILRLATAACVENCKIVLAIGDAAI